MPDSQYQALLDAAVTPGSPTTPDNAAAPAPDTTAGSPAVTPPTGLATLPGSSTGLFGLGDAANPLLILVVLGVAAVLVLAWQRRKK